MNKQKQNTKAKRVKSNKAGVKLKPARNKKSNKNISNLPILVDWRVRSLLERGLQQRVVQPQVVCQAEVEDHRLAKQQVKRPEPRIVHEVVRLVCVELPEYLLRVGLSEPEPCDAPMGATEVRQNLLA